MDFICVRCGTVLNYVAVVRNTYYCPKCGKEAEAELRNQRSA